MHFWVEPDCMGQGVGRALFADALREAARLRCRELRIESDPNAEPFYRKVGAIPRGRVAAPVAGERGRWLPVLTCPLAVPC
jgi:GNAT superfamily N-acetyltransferase